VVIRLTLCGTFCAPNYSLAVSKWPAKFHGKPEKLRALAQGNAAMLACLIGMRFYQPLGQ
jgi:hypothetical protein